MIEFAGTRDRSIFAASGRAATMRAAHPPVGPKIEPDRFEPARHQSDFWSQVPVVLFTMATVVAIFLVNHKTEAAPSQLRPPAATVEVKAAPVDCAHCGEVTSIRPLAVEESGDSAAMPEGAVLVEVRMNDGTVRAIKQLPNGLDVGDRVQVQGNTLIAGS